MNINLRPKKCGTDRFQYSARGMYILEAIRAGGVGLACETSEQ